MKIDNSEFIARHHKTAQPASLAEAQKKNYESVLVVGALFILSAVLLFMAVMVDMSQSARIITALGFGATAFGALAAWRSYSKHASREGALLLIKSVLDGSRGARMITDSSDNTVYYNQRFERLCRGVGPPSYASLVRLFHHNSEAKAHFDMLADKAHRGLTDSIELFSKHEDQERWLTVTAQPVGGYAGYIHWRVDDVTERFSAERAIREEREKLIDFTDNAPVGFFSVDENGRFIFANATFARWVGEDLSLLLEQGTLHTYMADPPQKGRPFDLVEDAGPRQVVEANMKGAAGSTFLAAINQAVVEEADGRVRTRAVVHDLTTERLMRTALKESEDRFQKFFEEAPLGIVLMDDQGMIADCNATFAAVLGEKVKQVEGTIFADWIDSDEQRAEALQALAKIEKGDQMRAPVELTLKGKAQNADVQMHARRFKESDSTVLHFIDVTQQKQLEEQFVQSQKMQAIGQLAGGVAHDFNNLLTAIIGFCDLLLLRHKPGDPSFGDIMQIKQNSNRAANLVRQLLAFSRQQTLRPRIHDVTDILTELSHLLRRLIGASVELELTHGPDLGLVKVDAGQMEQVLINLAVNARDAMSGQGQLHIETLNYSNKKAQELVAEELPPGHWTLIKVTDTGCGIPKENMQRIFEPFFTTKDVGEGTGLGLATVYGIIRQTDGFLDVQSVPDQGTTFLIYLPRATESEEEDDDDVQSDEEDSTKDLTGTERILLVEDEDAVRTFSQRALVNKGYEVLTADDGSSALALIQAEENKHLDLLITDVVMPNMDGPTLAKHMREENADLKIIFVSGYTEDKLKDYMGANIYFLPKPFTLKQLAAKVKDVLEE